MLTLRARTILLEEGREFVAPKSATQRRVPKMQCKQKRINENKATDLQVLIHHPVKHLLAIMFNPLALFLTRGEKEGKTYSAN